MKKKSPRGHKPGPYIETVLFDRSRIADPSHYAFQFVFRQWDPFGCLPGYGPLSNHQTVP
jgi:hypothetical protein